MRVDHRVVITTVSCFANTLSAAVNRHTAVTRAGRAAERGGCGPPAPTGRQWIHRVIRFELALVGRQSAICPHDVRSPIRGELWVSP